MIKERKFLQLVDETLAQREQQYGTTKHSIETIATLWTHYLEVKVTPSDVALMMILLKVARAMHQEVNLDNFIDIAGYATLGGIHHEAEQRNTSSQD